MKKNIIYFLLATSILLVYAKERSEKLVRVIDGDTVELSSGRVRLWGIDSPEIKQKGGINAKKKLTSLLQGKIYLIPLGKDKYKRTLGILICGNKIVNIEMVKQGYAWSESFLFEIFEIISRNKKIGIWNNENIIHPKEYRKINKY